VSTLGNLCFNPVLVPFTFPANTGITVSSTIVLSDSVFAPGIYRITAEYRFYVGDYQKLPDLEVSFRVE
jgi:hypothetical protein